MITVYLLDYYIGSGTADDPYRAACMDKLDGTITLIAPLDNIIPAPNCVTVSAEVEDISAVEQHPDYGPAAILYDDPNPYPGGGKPNANEHGKRRSYCAKLGITGPRFTALFGSNGNPKTRKDAADNLIAWQKTLSAGG
jgi:hypothetical protein